MSTTKTATSYKLSLGVENGVNALGTAQVNPYLSAASSWMPPTTNALLWPMP